MAKVDLDLAIRSILRFLPITEIEPLKQITNELRAAREFISKVKEIEVSLDESIKYDELKFAAVCDALRVYEWATK